MITLTLTRNQRYQLRQQLQHTQDAALYRRTLALLEIDRGKSISHLARSLRVTRQTIYNWIELYTQSFDPLALRDADRCGRPTSWTPDLDELLATLLQERPTQWGYQATNWTVPLLQHQFASWDGSWLSEDTIRRKLHELGYVWKRPRYVLPADPDGEKKKIHPSAA
jgi:transposase